MSHQETQREPLYQVWVTDTSSGDLVAIFPKVNKEAAEQFRSVVAEQIRLGTVKFMSDPHIAAHLG